MTVGDGPRVVAMRILAGYDRIGCAETGAGRMNLVHDRASHPYAEESAPSTRPRILAAAHLAESRVAAAAGEGPTPFLDSIEMTAITPDSANVHAPGLVAAISLAARPPTLVRLAGTTVRGPALRIVRAAPDGSAFAGERLASVDGAFELARPGTVSVVRLAGGAVEATVESGIRLDRDWAGGVLGRLSVRRGAGPFVPIAPLDEAGVAPDALVRRLARSAGTRLVTIRFDAGG
jgi:hypothetical protein